MCNKGNEGKGRACKQFYVWRLGNRLGVVGTVGLKDLGSIIMIIIIMNTFPSRGKGHNDGDEDNEYNRRTKLRIYMSNVLSVLQPPSRRKEDDLWRCAFGRKW